MPQTSAWEKEYKNPKMITNSDEPAVAFKDFVRRLCRKEKFEFENAKVLDLGSGTGKNAFYLANLGSFVSGIEISKEAVKISKKRGEKYSNLTNFTEGDFGKALPFENEYFDLVLDVTSSNSLNEKERSVYLKEVVRVLKSGGYMFVRALCKDGDKNAQNLLKLSPGKEKDTYFMEDLGLTERVFSRGDFEDIYSKDFDILSLEKDSSYTTVGGRKYKRNFWLAYLKKK
ncbi:MAG: class I SAM-dependent methyltransferase [Candidatus Paceibacterota bacterium]